MKGIPRPKHVIEKIRAAQIGRPKPAALVQRISAALKNSARAKESRFDIGAFWKGKRRTAEGIARGVENRKWFKPSRESISAGADKRRGKVRTPEQRARISAAITGRKLSAEHVAKMSIAAKAQWAKRKALANSL